MKVVKIKTFVLLVPGYTGEQMAEIIKKNSTDVIGRIGNNYVEILTVHQGVVRSIDDTANFLDQIFGREGVMYEDEETEQLYYQISGSFTDGVKANRRTVDIASKLF